MKRPRKLGLLLIAAICWSVVLTCLISTPTAQAANPTTISFQGKVVNSNGTNVTDGTYTFLFKMYTVSSGGAAVWTETDSLTVTAGVFQVNLGSNCSFFVANACNNSTPIDFNANPALYLGMTFNSDAAGEMSPRVQMQSVPFAYNADKVGGFSASQLVKLSPGSADSGFINVTGAGTFGGVLTVSSGGAAISGNSTISGTLGSLTGLTLASGNILQNGVGTFGTGSGAVALNGATTVSSTLNVTGLTTLSNSSGNSLAITGAPTATATTSLVRLGNAISGGDTTVNGGTYLGINEPAAGSAGTAADFVNFENNNTSVFDIDSTGTITLNGGLTGGVTNDTRATEVGTATYTEASAKLGYYLSANSTTTNTSFTTTFNITGLPAVDGTNAYISGVAIKGATGIARQHTVVIQIGGSTIATIATLNQTAASTVSRSFIVMRLGGSWQVMGEGPTAAPASTTSTVNTADYAEWIHYSGSVAPQPGEILSVGDEPVSVKRSATAYDKTLLGVVSTSPYQVGGADDGHSVIIALTGRVPVRVNLQNGPVHRGDKLTASSTPGEAMRATAAGQVIGTALESYDGSQPSKTVQVQLSVGYNNPGDIVSANLVASGGLAVDAGGKQTTSLSPANNTGISSSILADGLRSDQTTSQHSKATADNSISGLKSDTNSSATFSTKPDGSLELSSSGAEKVVSVSGTGGGVNGDIITTGSPSSRSLVIVNAEGKRVVSFSPTGDATISGNLNVTNATLSGGLNVGGDVNVAGLSSFQKLATFLGKTIFRQDVEFAAHVTVAKDSAGYAKLKSGETTVHVSFAAPYTTPPVVNATISDGPFSGYTTSNVSVTGFDIKLQAAATSDETFSWTALGINNPQTASNAPVPTP